MAVLSMWTFATLLFTLQTHVAVKGLPAQNLHHHMTKREIEYFFGVDHHDKVPEYDIASPYQSNHQGDFMSYSLHPSRNKRDTEPHEPSFYKLDAFGSKLHLKLKRNEQLMDPGMTVSRLNSDGTTTSHPAPQNTFYLGEVVSDPRSSVAVHNDCGLSGLVKTSGDTLFLHPIPAHLTKHVTSNEEATPHLVYRRSLKENDVLCETTKDKDTSRFSRSLEAGDVPDLMSDSARPKFKTLKVGLMYPPSLKEKYSTGFLGSVEKELLVTLNVVASMFYDRSIGEIKVSIVVTSIVEINPAQYHFNPSDSIFIKLRKISSKVAHDNAVSKVSYDVFTYISNAIPSSALATFNKICQGPTGNVNSDKGLQTALHIAHEIAHNMGIDHAAGSCGGYIMNSVITGGQHATEWSQCSRDAIQKFLADDKRSHCLDDGPTGDRPTIPPEFRNKLPGQILDGDKQCETQYGNGYKRHDTGQCGYLKCRSGNTLLSNNVVVMDGTQCGYSKWCIKGKCGTMAVIDIDGGWTEWRYSACSRTCGGGLKYKSRQCTNPRPQNGKYCEGPHRQYSGMCNTKPCPIGAKKFRELQCQQRWNNSVIYFLSNKPCLLYCRIGGRAKYYGSVVDGTRCNPYKPNDFSVCAQGSCNPVGCDHVFRSKTMFDRCGICGGIGNTCVKVSSVYNGNPSASGPDNAALVAELSPGTRNAYFRVAANTNNYLGVQNDLGNYLVGGHKGGNQNKLAAGTKIEYGHKTKRKGRDWIRILNPTNATLSVMYICKYKPCNNPGVRYTFTAPTQLAGAGGNELFEWLLGDWSSCNKTCASGIRTRSLRCVRKDDGSPASDSACAPPASETEPCNTQPCDAKWSSKWLPCSKSCGQGKEVYRITCKEEVAENKFRETDSCTDAKPAPPTPSVRVCNDYPCRANWTVGNWSECPFKCVVGKIQRRVSCSRTDEAGMFTVVADELCRYLDKPASKAKCNDDNPCGARPPTCPADHVCSNGGQCQPDPSGYQCVCDRGFTGLECEIKLNPCDKDPCLNGGTCSPGVSHHYDHTCQCKEHFTGRNCETAITACMSNPCLNGGKCTDDGTHDKYKCACPEGFTGTQCEVVILACTKNPCLNGGTCTDNGAHDKYTCACPEEFKGEQCQVAIPACTRNPCLNNGTCTDDGAHEYNCTCPEGFVGKECQVSSFYKIGCFVYKRRVIPELQQDQRSQLITEPAVLKCAQLVQEKGYRVFAVGQNGAKCYSGPKAGELYFKYGSAYLVKCKNGIGTQGAMFVYTFDTLPTYEQVGCYAARGRRRRHVALRTKLLDLRKQFNKDNIQLTIEQCARLALVKGFPYFALKSRAYCASDQNAAKNYNKYGPSSNCKDGVGSDSKANMVYKLKANDIA